MRTIVTDAIDQNGVPVEANRMATQNEAVTLRDSFWPLNVLADIPINPYIDTAQLHFTQQDSHGLSAWLIAFKDGSTYRVSHMLDMMEQQPGSKWVPDGSGGVKYLVPPKPEAPISKPTGSPYTGSPQDYGGAMNPQGFSNTEKAIMKKLDEILSFLKYGA